jgi:hypothetical protein
MGAGVSLAPVFLAVGIRWSTFLKELVIHQTLSRSTTFVTLGHKKSLPERRLKKYFTVKVIQDLQTKKH